MNQEPGPGGFLPPRDLPIPPSSPVDSVGKREPILPQPRVTPLKSGSQKQSSFIDYVDNKLLHISRRYEKRCNPDSVASDREMERVRGYTSFEEMAKDLEAITDMVWMSSTRKKRNTI